MPTKAVIKPNEQNIERPMTVTAGNSKMHTGLDWTREGLITKAKRDRAELTFCCRRGGGRGAEPEPAAQDRTWRWARTRASGVSLRPGDVPAAERQCCGTDTRRRRRTRAAHTRKVGGDSVEGGGRCGHSRRSTTRPGRRCRWWRGRAGALGLARLGVAGGAGGSASRVVPLSGPASSLPPPTAAVAAAAAVLRN